MNTTKTPSDTLAISSRNWVGCIWVRYDQPTFAAFYVDLEERYAPRTANGVASDVRALFNFLEADELILKSPVRKVKLPKMPKTILPAFTPSEIEKLLATCAGKTFYDIRNRALILVLLDSGVRLKEASEMKIGDVDPDTGVFKVLGKGSKERFCIVSLTTLKCLRYYLRLRGGKDGEPLWSGSQGTMTRFGVAHLIQKLGKAAGVHAHPHKFRRTTALTLITEWSRRLQRSSVAWPQRSDGSEALRRSESG